MGTMALATVGCGPSESDEVHTWVTAASAPAVYWQVHEPIEVGLGQGTAGDGMCPAVSDDGTTITLEGECSTSDGGRRFGRAVITRGASEGDLSIALTGYGGSTDLGDVRMTGTATVERMSADEHAFEVMIAVDALTDTTYDYAGTVRGGFEGPTTWNGTGTLVRDGFAPTGQITASTVDEVLDGSMCNGQPLSGRTTIQRGTRTDVITYDGASDCDEARSARWTADGVDRGLLADIACAASPGRRAPPSILFVMAAPLAVRGGRRAIARVARRAR